MSVTFRGTYTKNDGAEPFAHARLWITPDGEPTETVQADANGSYEYVYSGAKERFTIVEQFPGGRTFDVNQASGVVDTSLDVGSVLDTGEGPGVYSDRGWFTDFDGVRTLVPSPEEE